MLLLPACALLLGCSLPDGHCVSLFDQKQPRVKKLVEKKVRVSPPAAGRSRLRRAAAVTARSYKEQDSEPEEPQDRPSKNRPSKNQHAASELQQHDSSDHLESPEKVHNAAEATQTQNQNQAVSRAASRSSGPGSSEPAAEVSLTELHVPLEETRLRPSAPSKISEACGRLRFSLGTVLYWPIHIGCIGLWSNRILGGLSADK